MVKCGHPEVPGGRKKPRNLFFRSAVPGASTGLAITLNAEGDGWLWRAPTRFGPPGRVAYRYRVVKV
jgi:hypothetical protein